MRNAHYRTHLLTHPPLAAMQCHGMEHNRTCWNEIEVVEVRRTSVPITSSLPDGSSSTGQRITLATAVGQQQT